MLCASNDLQITFFERVIKFPNDGYPFRIKTFCISVDSGVHKVFHWSIITETQTYALDYAYVLYHVQPTLTR